MNLTVETKFSGISDSGTLDLHSKCLHTTEHKTSAAIKMLVYDSGSLHKSANQASNRRTYSEAMGRFGPLPCSDAEEQTGTFDPAPRPPNHSVTSG